MRLPEKHEKNVILKALLDFFVLFLESDLVMLKVYFFFSATMLRDHS